MVVQPSLSDDSIEMLVCPVCRAELARAEEGLMCVACGRRYPIVDGIPVLLADRAVVPEGGQG